MKVYLVIGCDFGEEPEVLAVSSTHTEAETIADDAEECGMYDYCRVAEKDI